MTTIQLYIGENNNTHKVERELIEKTLAKYHDGFTILPCVGYWQGGREQSVAVVVADEQSKIMHTIAVLKKVLKQDAIAYQVVSPLEFV